MSTRRTIACATPGMARSIHGGEGGEGGGGGGVVGASHSRRLGLLIVAIAMMSGADLLCTLAYMSTIGLIEANPFARFMVSVGDIPQLVMFKAFTTLLSCGALYLARRHPLSEKVAWLCAAMLLALMLHWTAFNRSVSGLTNEITVLSLHGGHEWWVPPSR